jgi:hypothetical protein
MPPFIGSQRQRRKTFPQRVTKLLGLRKISIIKKGGVWLLMKVIELPDEQVAALTAKAAAAGLTLEAWLNKLASADPSTTSAERPLQTAADIVLSHMRKVPPEIMETMPKDGASQHDHYIYGWPKREA